MGMAKTLEELRSLSDEELVRRHDREAEGTVVGVDYYLDELHRRDVERTNQIVVDKTKRITELTWMITGLTLVNAVAAAAQAL